jgi:MscS family membrane protein
VLILDTPLWKLLATLLAVMLSIGVLLAVHRWTRPPREDLSPTACLRRLIVPIAVLLLALWFRLFFLLQINLQGDVAEVAELALSIVRFFAGAWAAYLGAMFIAEWIVASPRIPDQSLDANLLRLGARIAGIVAAITLLAYGARDLGIPIFGVIAGLGVGGLAVALAAQNTLGNLLGSLNLFADRPLRVGDVCQYGDKVGTVESIGIRSTRLRGVDRTVTTMPNAELAQMPVTNFSRRDKILFHKRVDLRYETSPDQLRLLLIKLRELLLAHPRVSEDPARVRLVDLASSSIQVEIFAYVTTRDWNDFLEVQQDLLLRIIELVNTIAAGFAFPSQTQYRPRDPGLDAADAAAASGEIEALRTARTLPLPEFGTERGRNR